MLHIENEYVRKNLLKGNFGLEKESIRVHADGSFSHTPHPFPDDDHIVKDFSENQTEINTGVHTSAAGAIEELIFHNRRINRKLASLPEPEYLWPFSNPPHIRGEQDIPVAVFKGEHTSKAEYREYLADKYGRYKMTFSGIHVNYSFADELLEADYAAGGFAAKEISFQDYKSRLYLDLAQALAEAGWVLVAVTAASPVMDASFVEKNVSGRDAFTGMGSVRCSEMGYWNEFAPVFDYSGLEAYAASIRKYENKGFLRAPSELYYPIRIKPPGENNLDSLIKNGINHIELRMFDLNPLVYAGVEEKDILFAQLVILWLLCTPERPFLERDQVHAVQNFKNAAHFDLKTVRMITPEGANTSIASAAKLLIGEVRALFDTVCPGSQMVRDVLDFELAKFEDAHNRYAWKVRDLYGENFAEKAMALAVQRQKESLEL